MRYFYLVLLTFLFSCKKEIIFSITPSLPPVEVIVDTVKPYNLTTQEINFSLPNISNSNLYGTSINSVSGFLNYEKDGVEHAIITPSIQTQELHPVHFIKKNNQWVFENYYSDVSIGSVRNYEKITNGTYAYSDHGIEYGEKWPFGHIWKFETIGEKLKWTQVSKVRSFYHSVSTGDFNSDGLVDIIGLNMGTYNNWFNNLHPYTQNTNSTYSENRDLITEINFKGPYGAGAVLCVNLFGDEKPEIIRADYGYDESNSFNFIRYSFIIFSYDNNTKQYEPIKRPGLIGVFTNTKAGATSMKSFDYDKDGDMDLVIAYEGLNNGIEIWENKGEGNFIPTNQRFEFTEQQLSFREFEIADINNDGYVDILLNPFHYGLDFRDGLTTYKFGDFGKGIKLNKCILINNKGKFEQYKKDIIIPNIKPGFMKGFFIDNKLKFIGLEYLNNKLLLHEVVIKI